MKEIHMSGRNFYLRATRALETYSESMAVFYLKNLNEGVTPKKDNLPIFNHGPTFLLGEFKTFRAALFKGNKYQMRFNDLRAAANNFLPRSW